MLCFARVEGRTVLMQAAHKGNERLVRLLIALGANANAVDRGPRTAGNSALTFAAGHGDPEIVRRLLDAGADPNPPKSALCAAVSSEAATTELLDLLVSRGARIQDADGRSVLGCLGVARERGELAAFLVSHGADADSLEAPGMPLIVSAAAGGRIHMLELLLSSGANLNARDRAGRTPLMAAAAYARVDAVRFLLDRGADPSLQDEHGRTALGLAWSAAEDERREERAQEFRDIVAFLMSRRADAN